METWSDKPIIDSFRIKFFLDTNILSYIVSNTYSGLIQTITYLQNSCFVDLISSKYVVFEFIDVRKKTLYLAEVNRIKGKQQALDPNIIIRYKEHFERVEVDFHVFKQRIQEQIITELEIIRSLDIICDSNLLHDNLLVPTKEITLFTKISREDSLILISSIWPEEYTKEDFIVLLTRDGPFVESFNEINLEPIFQKHSLSNPIVEYIESMQLGGVYYLNLTLNSDDIRIPEYLNNKIKELIIKKNQKYFLGKTIQCGNSSNFPINVVCFSLIENTMLHNNLYLTIIGKDLDFMYSTKLAVTSFWDQTEIQNYPFQSNQGTNISFRPEENNNNKRVPLPQIILNRLRETGNLVFINPDGE